MNPLREPKNSEILIYQNTDGQIKIDVMLDQETVWLTQKLMAQLFQVKPQNITIHLKNIYLEGELNQTATCKEFLQVQTEGGRKVERKQKFYNLDAILFQLNGRELLSHVGKISHTRALEKSTQEYEKYRAERKALRKEASLQELEMDIKELQAITSGKGEGK